MNKSKSINQVDIPGIGLVKQCVINEKTLFDINKATILQVLLYIKGLHSEVDRVYFSDEGQWLYYLPDLEQTPTFDENIDIDLLQAAADAAYKDAHGEAVLYVFAPENPILPDARFDIPLCSFGSIADVVSYLKLLASRDLLYHLDDDPVLILWDMGVVINTQFVHNIKKNHAAMWAFVRENNIDLWREYNKHFKDN